MLPYLYEFHWSAGHLLFITVFGGVALTIGTAVVVAAVRAGRRE